MATFIGSSQAGLPGALVATLGVVLPSFVLILLVAAVLRSVPDPEGGDSAGRIRCRCRCSCT